MENFTHVLAICRTALRNENPTLVRQVTKLRDALQKKGELEQASALTDVLESKQSAQSLVPSELVLNGLSAAVAETLSPSVHPPVDRETAAPLASIVFPEQLKNRQPPILDERLDGAIKAFMDEWGRQDELLQVGVQPITSLLLYGHPGTGKTELAKEVAYQLQAPIILARLDGLISSLLGTTAKNISNLFEFANRYRCVLLLDEFDAVAKIRDDPHEIGEIKRVVNTLLQCLDERRVRGFTIAVTNHEHLLDSAIWRRFDATIEVPLPAPQVRRLIIERYMRGIEITKEEIEFLTWLTDGDSGAQIETMCNSIKRHHVMNGVSTSFLEASKLDTILRGRHINHARRLLLDDSKEKIAQALVSADDFNFTQNALATLLGTTQSTVSRWVRSKDE